MKAKLFRTVVALALCGPACGRVVLDRPGEAGRDAGAGVDAPTATDVAPPGDDAAPALPPFATIIRVINGGPADFKLYGSPTMTCPYGFGIQGGAPVVEGKPLETPDFGCECTTCGVDGRPRCWTTDPLCQDPPVVLSPGAHFDFPWDGRVQAWVPPPDGSGCAASCTALLPVPAGTYEFTLGHDPVPFTVQAALPAPGGVVEMPVTAP